MEKLFLAKVLDNNDRDEVKYIEFRGFECGHYFSGLHIVGACFSGFEKELRERVVNDFESIKTVLTKEEFLHLFELDDKLESLGYKIEKDSEKYKKGIEIMQEYHDTIEKKLLSEENEQLFKKIVEEEKEQVKNEYNLSSEEVEEIFDNNPLDYQDKGIISAVYDNIDEFVEEEKWSMGWNDFPYFDDEKFAEDLLGNSGYYELENGRIVVYNM